MLCTLGRFLQNRGLKLNANKTKIMLFNKTGKEKKEKWNWKKEQIEEVDKFKYLEFTFNKKGDYTYPYEGYEKKRKNSCQ